MKRIFATFALCAIAMQAFPVVTHAAGDATLETCSIDGYLSNSIPNPPTSAISADALTLPLEIQVSNNSSEYHYGGVSLGVALYEPGGSTPAYWSVVADDLQFEPAQPQIFEVELDVQHVEAGEYEIRVGSAQGGQFEALIQSQISTGASFIKNNAAAIEYPFTLTQQNSELRPGVRAQYVLTAENTEEAIVRGYEQALVFVKGDASFAAVVADETKKEVKMGIGGTESLQGSVFLEDVSYSVYGFSTKTNTLLPVVTDSFRGGDTVNTVSLVPGVGISGLDSDTITVAACPAIVSGDIQTLGAVIDIEHKVMNSEGEVVAAGYLDASSDSMVTVQAPKVGREYNIVTTIYGEPVSLTSEEITAGVDPRGNVIQVISQTVGCSAEECEQAGVAETIESFVAEEVVQKTIWFYLGIILAAALLMFLMIGRLTTKEEEAHPGIDNSN